MSGKPIVIVDPHFRRMDEIFSIEDRARLYDTGVIFSAHRAGSVREGLWESSWMTDDDLEAIVMDVPPRRLQNAKPELALRYVTCRVPAREAN